MPSTLEINIQHCSAVIVGTIVDKTEFMRH